jgi:hypothetical protein
VRREPVADQWLACETLRTFPPVLTRMLGSVRDATTATVERIEYGVDCRQWS